jgi:hypothetical protein
VQFALAADDSQQTTATTKIVEKVGSDNNTKNVQSHSAVDGLMKAVNKALKPDKTEPTEKFKGQAIVTHNGGLLCVDYKLLSGKYPDNSRPPEPKVVVYQDGREIASGKCQYG